MHVAVSDCERIRPGRVAQPVNTVSSLAYCVAGSWVLARRRCGAGRVSLGVGAVAAGLGSAAYHGPGGRGARLLHDLTAATLGAAMAVALLEPGREGRARRAVAAGSLAAAGAVHAASRTGRPLCRPDSRWQGHALWHVLGAVAVVLLAAE